MQRGGDSVITDEMLKQAAEEAANMMNDELSEQAASQKHQFSPRFERKVKRIIRRTSHSAIYRFLRSVACILLIATIGIGSILTVNVEARAAVIKWIKEQFETYQGYIFKGENVDDAELSRYYLGWIPEGYELVFSDEDENGGTYVYTDEQGRIAQFNYIYGQQGSATFIKTEGYDKYAITVNGLPAELYVAIEEKDSDGIIWTDDSRNVIFHFSAHVDRESLIKIAENVEKNEFK